MAAKQQWRVVGGVANTGGILVREGVAITSPQLSKRLQTGAVVEEWARVGERLHYRILSGDGPVEGWVSLKVKDKVLLAPLAEAIGADATAATVAAGAAAAALGPPPPAAGLQVEADQVPPPLRDIFNDAHRFLEGRWAGYPAIAYRPNQPAAALAAKCEEAMAKFGICDAVPAACLVKLGELHFRGGSPVQAATVFQSAKQSAAAESQKPGAELAKRLAHLGVAASAQCAEELQQEGGPSCADGASSMTAALALHQCSFASFEDANVDEPRYLGDRTADAAIVLLHGNGGNGLDLQSAGTRLLAQIKQPCRLLLPRGFHTAPNLIGQPGYSWRDNRSDRCDPFRWDSVLRALAQLGAILDFLQADGVPPERVMIGGFSQGSFFSLLLALTRTPRVGGVVVLGGAVGGRVAAFVSTMTGGVALPDRGDIPVFMGHGEKDEQVPVAMGQAAVQELKSLGVTKVTFTAYEGVAHVVSDAAVDDAARSVCRWFGVAEES